jgi:hypothetical protein
LAISETSDFGTIECRFNDWSNDCEVQLLVGSELIKSSIEIELVLFDVLGEVDFGSGGEWVARKVIYLVSLTMTVAD